MIDFHTHPVMIKELLVTDPELEKNIHEVFGFHFPAQPLEIFRREMDAAGVEQAVLLPIDTTTAHGCHIVSNEQVAELVSLEPRFIGFASVDPNLPDAAQRINAAVHNLGLKGLKLDPSLQKFWPNDEQVAFPIFQACADLGIPVLLHSGLSWTPSGLAQYAQPLLLEQALMTFPRLNFVLAHFGWPWINEAVMLAVKYRNVYLDISIMYSGTPRDTYRRVLAGQVGLEVIERSLADRIVFGTNYPRIDMRRCVRGLRELGLSPAALESISRGNARRLLGQETER